MRKQLRQPITVADPISRTTHMPRHPLRSRLLAAVADESGSVTAEYAIATMAAVGFAGLLVVILRGDEVRGMLTDMIHRALTVAG